MATPWSGSKSLRSRLSPSPSHVKHVNLHQNLWPRAVWLICYFLAFSNSCRVTATVPLATFFLCPILTPHTAATGEPSFLFLTSQIKQSCVISVYITFQSFPIWTERSTEVNRIDCWPWHSQSSMMGGQVTYPLRASALWNEPIWEKAIRIPLLKDWRAN